MTTQAQIDKNLKALKEIIQKSELIDDSYIVGIDKVIDNMQGFKIYLPLVGNFSAGKSSILNTLLGNDELLATDILPKTAIATEILYSKDERVEAYSFDSDEVVDRFESINKVEEIEKYGYLKLYQDVEYLSQHPDIIFVDMPGLDSNIDRHNRQIFNYVQKEGIGFVAVIDIDDGGIRESTLRFIEEIDSYKVDFFVIINKIDKKPSSQHQKIKDSIKGQLSKYSKEPFVGATSAIDGDIDEFKEIVLSIDRDRYIKSIFLPKANSIREKIISNLSIRRDSILLDTTEIDNRIDELIEGIYQLQKSLKKEKQSIANRFSTNTISQILGEVDSALRDNIDRLVVSAETSEESFKTTINDIIRPVMVNSIEKYTQQVFSVTIDRLEESSQDIFADITDLSQKSKMAIDIVSATIQATPILMKIPTLLYILEIISTKVNPILVVISTVISIATLFFGKSKEEQQQESREQFKNRILNTIPEIISQLRPTVEESLNEIKDNFFIEIENSIKEQKDELINSLNQAKDDKRVYQDEIGREIERYNILIKSVDTICTK